MVYIFDEQGKKACKTTGFLSYKANIKILDKQVKLGFTRACRGKKELGKKV